MIIILIGMIFSNTYLITLTFEIKKKKHCILSYLLNNMVKKIKLFIVNYNFFL